MKNIGLIVKKNYKVVEKYAKKHSPEILTGAGVVSIVAGTVMACKATLKLSDTLEETKKNLEAVKQAENDCPDYTDEDKTKDLTIIYGGTVLNVIKLYAVPALLTTTGISCMLTSNKILRNRNAALTAAYVAIDSSFKEYRNRVATKFGKDTEYNLRHGIDVVEIDAVDVDENGNEVVTKEFGKTIGVPSDYARIFDPSNPNWQPDAQYNLMFLNAQQRYANDKLQVEGVLFLNDVYEMLGIPKTKAGQIVGWTYNCGDENADNYVDFGLQDIDKEQVRNFINGYEKNIWLDFNVDGPVWDKM